MSDDAGALVVLRCESCGDTFPASDPKAAICPSCGGGDHTVAQEPLL